MLQELFDECERDRGDVIHALGRWQPSKTVCKSCPCIPDPGSIGKLERFFGWPDIVYGTNLGAGGQAIVYPAKTKGGSEFTMALKESYEMPGPQWHNEVQLLKKLRGQPNVIRQIRTMWNAKTQNGYQLLE